MHLARSLLRSSRTRVSNFSTNFSTTPSRNCNFIMTRATFRDQSDLDRWLNSHGVSTSEWGKGSAKSVKDLFEEYEAGESSLELNFNLNSKPQRVVRVLNLFIKNSKGQFLMEESSRLPNGTERKRGLPVSEKLTADEDWRGAVSRAVFEELGPALVPPASSIDDASARVQLDESTLKEREESSDSRSYPGLHCIYKTVSVQAAVRGAPEDKASFEVKESREGGFLVTTWAWKDPAAFKL